MDFYKDASIQTDFLFDIQAQSAIKLKSIGLSKTERAMMAKRIYVEVDNLHPLLEWLKTKPEGEVNVMIGGTTDSVSAVLKYLGSDLSLAKWIYDKTAQGEFNIQSIPEGSELPIGIVLED